jgi:Family of unknown function (DUF6356)
MKHFFTGHPASVGESYAEHFAFAMGVGGRMVAGGLACMLHAVLPEFCKTTGSRTIRELALHLVPANRGKHNIAASSASPAFEPLFTAAELESLTSASL